MCLSVWLMSHCQGGTSPINCQNWLAALIIQSYIQLVPLAFTRASTLDSEWMGKELLLPPLVGLHSITLDTQCKRTTSTTPVRLHVPVFSYRQQHYINNVPLFQESHCCTVGPDLTTSLY